ncbi:MAG: hypothetical protein GF334_08510 [Candidatus Altiarchaeales archaeon]|nr:hypothetical protein [Candidatus Altiarchaeales archaeon]
MHNKYEELIYHLPAAVYYHHNWVGGWADHTAQVIQISSELFDSYIVGVHHDLKVSLDDVIVAAFVHDFDKLWCYKDAPPKKTEKGKVTTIEPQPGKFVRNDDIVKYEETSKAIAEAFRAGIKLTDQQIEAINHHHGGFSTDLSSPHSRRGGMTPFSTLMHCADMLSAFNLGHCKPGVKIMPDFSSSGIWELHGGAMLEYKDLGVPSRLKKQLKDWIEFHDSKCTERPSYLVKPDMAGELNHKGLELAKKVKKIHPDLDVWYWGDLGKGKGLVKKEIKGS